MSDASPGGYLGAPGDNLIAPPGLLGYSHLVKPDEFTPPGKSESDKNFKLNWHCNDPQEAAFRKRLHAAVDALWPKFLAEAAKAKRPRKVTKVKGKFVESDWVKPDVDAWVDSAMQPFKEGATIEVPYFTFANAAEYKDRKSGEVRLKRIRATDSTGETPIDIEKAKLGMKSVIQPILRPTIYVSTTSPNGDPAISLKLQALKVIKLEQYGGQQSAGNITDEDMELAGTEVQDLSGYVVATKEEHPHAKAASKESPEGEAYADDLDSEIPF